MASTTISQFACRYGLVRLAVALSIAATILFLTVGTVAAQPGQGGGGNNPPACDKGQATNNPHCNQDAESGDANEGDANEGDANEGDANEGDANEGDAYEGDANEGDANEGDANEGEELGNQTTPNNSGFDSSVSVQPTASLTQQDNGPARGFIIRGIVATSGGFGLVAFSGGSLDDLVIAAACSPEKQLSIWAAVDGKLTGYIPGAPAVVNAVFLDRYAEGIPAGALFLTVCR